MSIFNQIGKKISDAGQETAVKAKNFAEIAKFNTKISDIEDRISILFLELGKEYYEENKDNEEAIEKIKEINSAYNEISYYKEQIKLIKGVEKCPNCGGDINNGSAFCSFCGAKIITETKGKVCPNCNASVDENDVFCNSCGKKLDTANIENNDL